MKPNKVTPQPTNQPKDASSKSPIVLPTPPVPFYNEVINLWNKRNQLAKFPIRITQKCEMSKNLSQITKKLEQKVYDWKTGEYLSSRIILYTIDSKISSGNYADTYKAVTADKNKTVCIKVIKSETWIVIDKKEKVKERQLLCEEIVNLASIKSPRVNELIEVLMLDHDRPVLVLRLCKCSLDVYLNQNPNMNIKQKISLISDIRDGLAVLHSHKIVHRDLKAENILVDFEGRAEIADLGFGKKVDNGLTKTKLGSEETIAPEVKYATEYNEKADIWSAGIVFYQILFGNLPTSVYMNIKSKEEFDNKVSQTKDKLITLPQNNDIPPVLYKLLYSMLKAIPEDRISYENFLKHPLCDPPPQVLVDVSHSFYSSAYFRLPCIYLDCLNLLVDLLTSTDLYFQPLLDEPIRDPPVPDPTPRTQPSPTLRAVLLTGIDLVAQQANTTVQFIIDQCSELAEDRNRKDRNLYGGFKSDVECIKFDIDRVYKRYIEGGNVEILERVDLNYVITMLKITFVVSFPAQEGRLMDGTWLKLETIIVTLSILLGLKNAPKIELKFLNDMLGRFHCDNREIIQKNIHTLCINYKGVPLEYTDLIQRISKLSPSKEAITT